MALLILPTVWIFSQIFSLGKSNLVDIGIIWLSHAETVLYFLLGTILFPIQSLIAITWLTITWPRYIELWFYHNDASLFSNFRSLPIPGKDLLGLGIYFVLVITLPLLQLFTILITGILLFGSVFGMIILLEMVLS